MTDQIRAIAIPSFAKRVSIFAAGAVLLAAPVVLGQTSPSTTDKWLHVRVVNAEDKSETVRVNIPLDLAEKVLPTINKDRLHDGKIRIDEERLHGDVDVRALMEAVRGAKDGEYVTVQGTDNDVRVAKEGGHLIVHVTDKSGHGFHGHHARHRDGDTSADDKDKSADKKDKAEMVKSNPTQVEIKVPMKVIDALLSAGKDELDIVAALHALAAQGDAELVSVKADDGATVRVWIDSKNMAN
jgi:hypothetical protein